MANQDQNLNYAWHVQKLGATAGQTGYSQHSSSPAENPVNLAAAAQASSGAPVLAPAGSDVTEVLTNPGYATGNGTLLGVVTAPAVPATTVGIQNPFGLAALVTIAANGATIASVSTAPNTGGTGGAGTYTQILSGAGQVTVPPGGWIKMSYTVATPTWAWTTIN